MITASLVVFIVGGLVVLALDDPRVAAAIFAVAYSMVLAGLP